jgi:uncharacterized protein YbaP (TraB family)
MNLVWKSRFVCLIVLISSHSFGQNSDIDNQLLWEISGNGLKKKSYLFGSFHTNDKRVFKLGDTTYLALNQAEALVLEADLTEMFNELDTRQEDVNVLFDNDGLPYSGTKKAGKTMYGDEDGMPQFLDAFFQQYCLNSGKQFYPLESIEDQMNLLDDKPETESRFNAFETRLISQEHILKLYLTGDINGLDKFMKTSLSIYPGFYNGLIIDRNRVMATGIDTLIKKQSCFIAVGAGHLAGDDGIINLLRRKGYRLHLVGHKVSENPTAEKKKILSYKTYTYIDETYKLKVVFPGKPLVVKEEDQAGLKLIYREYGQGNTYEVEVVEKGAGNLESFATDYILNPRSAKTAFELLDDGTWIAQGISDTYPEGISWVRIIEGETHMVLIKTYGGNKFMNSKRPMHFFNNVWLDYEN